VSFSVRNRHNEGDVSECIAHYVTRNDRFAIGHLRLL
jgi:hypothetical protein